MAPDQTADVVLAGGGLANSLVALRLKALRPGLRVVMLEQADAPCDAHTWSYFATDVPSDAAQWLTPLERRRWPGYLVRFPGYDRDVATAYASIDEGQLQARVQAVLGDDLRRGARVTHLTPDTATLADGEVWRAPLVLDGRGAAPSPHLWLAWQKFQGVELQLKRPHGLERPTVMDASVPQLDGFRFVYLLPFDAATVLVEDTRYSHNAVFEPEVVEADALRYARDKGWTAAVVGRKERGVLPIALGGSIDDFWADQPAGLPSVGMRAALFHPTTGYSLPDAVRVADLIARSPDLTSGAIRALVEARSKALWAERGFYRALNRMMFLACSPDQRWRVLDRFYRLPKPLIERFYAGQSTLADRLRLVAGKPPVPVGAAMKAFLSTPPRSEALSA